jgi:hypothetical protein
MLKFSKLKQFLLNPKILWRKIAHFKEYSICWNECFKTQLIIKQTCVDMAKVLEYPLWKHQPGVKESIFFKFHNLTNCIVCWPPTSVLSSGVKRLLVHSQIKQSLVLSLAERRPFVSRRLPPYPFVLSLGRKIYVSRFSSSWTNDTMLSLVCDESLWMIGIR